MVLPATTLQTDVIAANSVKSSSLAGSSTFFAAEKCLRRFSFSLVAPLELLSLTLKRVEIFGPRALLRYDIIPQRTGVMLAVVRQIAQGLRME